MLGVNWYKRDPVDKVSFFVFKLPLFKIFIVRKFGEYPTGIMSDTLLLIELQILYLVLRPGACTTKLFTAVSYGFL
jgi:hypothetical protein